MKLKYFDSHTHVQFAAFEKDYREVIARALEVGAGLINVGTQRDTSRRAVVVAHEYENLPVFGVVGLHPIHTVKSYHDPHELGEGDEAKGFTSRGEEFDYDYYKKLALDPKVVAIGECGLDYFRIENEEAKEKQKTAFLDQMKLAREVGKPLMIHCRETPSPSRGRNAFSDLTEIMMANKDLLNPNPGIIHFFTGTKDDAKNLLDLGFYFTFGGVITFVRDYDEVIKMIPVERILSETDAPYVSPVPHRGKRNEPAYVVEVVKKLAEIKEVSLEKMREKILDNIRSVFGINLSH